MVVIVNFVCVCARMSDGGRAGGGGADDAGGADTPEAGGAGEEQPGGDATPPDGRKGGAHQKDHDCSPSEDPTGHR